MMILIRVPCFIMAFMLQYPIELQQYQRVNSSEIFESSTFFSPPVVQIDKDRRSLSSKRGASDTKVVALWEDDRMKRKVRPGLARGGNTGTETRRTSRCETMSCRSYRREGKRSFLLRGKWQLGVRPLLFLRRASRGKDVVLAELRRVENSRWRRETGDEQRQRTIVQSCK